MDPSLLQISGASLSSPRLGCPEEDPSPLFLRNGDEKQLVKVYIPITDLLRLDRGIREQKAAFLNGTSSVITQRKTTRKHGKEGVRPERISKFSDVHSRLNSVKTPKFNLSKWITVTRTAPSCITPEQSFR